MTENNLSNKKVLIIIALAIAATIGFILGAAAIQAYLYSTAPIAKPSDQTPPSLNSETYAQYVTRKAELENLGFTLQRQELTILYTYADPYFLQTNFGKTGITSTYAGWLEWTSGWANQECLPLFAYYDYNNQTNQYYFLSCTQSDALAYVNTRATGTEPTPTPEPTPNPALRLSLMGLFCGNNGVAPESILIFYSSNQTIPIESLTGYNSVSILKYPTNSELTIKTKWANGTTTVTNLICIYGVSAFFGDGHNENLWIFGEEAQWFIDHPPTVTVTHLWP